MSGIHLQALAIDGIRLSAFPDFVNALGAASDHTFTGVTISAVNGVPAGYTWSVISQSGGTFTIFSGQGTATAVARVTGVLPATTATATLRCAVDIGAGSIVNVDVPLSYENTT